jgi:hypothetical protein
MSGRLRRLAGRIGGGAAPPCPDEAARPNPAQRAWLLKDVGQDLAAMIDDAENRGVTEQGAREMLVIHALVGWLEGGDPPAVEAIRYLERVVKTIPGSPDEGELAKRSAYLSAIGELGGDAEMTGEPWRDGVDERTRPLLDFQGRKLRRRIEELGLTIGELAKRSGIETVALVAILFGQDEMRVMQWLDLSVALEVPLEWMLEGVRFLPRTSPEGRGFYEI